MRYVTSIERLAKEEGHEQGLQEGIEQGLEQGIEQGLEQGIQRGRQEGYEQGRQQMLAVMERLFMRRFGDLPGWVRERLQGANAHDIEIWGERLLDASSLEAVFAEPS